MCFSFLLFADKSFLHKKRPYKTFIEERKKRLIRVCKAREHKNSIQINPIRHKWTFIEKRKVRSRLGTLSRFGKYLKLTKNTVKVNSY